MLVRNLVGTGAPIVSMLLIVWLFAMLAGANVMPFLRAVLLFAAFGAGVSIFLSLLYLTIRQVQITPNNLTVGLQKWSKKSIVDYAWERRSIDGFDHAVLHVSTRRESIRVALPLGLPPKDVERVLDLWGIRRGKRSKDPTTPRC